jgi:hypothetical protein
MKKIKFLLILLSCCKSFYSQNCYQILSYDLKSIEVYNLLFYKDYINIGNAFNYIGNNYNPNIYHQDPIILDSLLKQQLGNLEFTGYVIESLITMYETTKDKAYLIKAINKSIELINKRGQNGGPSVYTWKGGMPYNPNPAGLVLWAMAHLCHVILYDYPELCSSPLPTNLLTPNTSNYPYTNGIATYGLFADWLVRRCVETLDWYLQIFWISSNEGFRDEHTPDFGAAINQQAPFAAAFFYLGHLSNIIPCFAYQGFYSGLASYTERAAELARLFTSNVKLYKDYYCSSSFPECFERPVFNFDLSKNSYWWFTRGWGYTKNEKRCSPLSNKEKRAKCSLYFDINPNASHIEDIGHGIRTLIYPLLCYKYNFISGGIPFFNTTDMFRFRNTFVNAIWNGDLNNPMFFYSVRGAGYNHLISSSTCTTCTYGQFQWIPMAWMPLYKYDYLASNNTTYEVIKKHFSNLLLNNGLGNFVNGEKVWGIAHIASAQWDKECVDLTLYNRRLTYNQDIYAKNTLTIAPQQEDCYHSLNDNSLAEPIITENKFIIEPGVTCTMKAGERIVLKAGFHAKAGCNFRAYIDPALCFSGRKTRSFEDENTESISWLQVSLENAERINYETENELTEPIEIYPNPTTGIININVQTLNQDESLQLRVFDVFGKEIINQQLNNSNNQQIDLSPYGKGVYFLQVINHKQESVVKKARLFSPA